ncbi:sugar phosphate isomerase/epimerase family protein [Chitinophaga niabensis]|uniref:Sugar phosphate isomerase/epimerase n=1 Tax=Chitinophaga niabensis TaxID=536979 RepID=A0A1N6DQB5_9BACT|nr:sugar phosphate isomerase/epimerase [Chitinophaga niabensis]SIN72995.1 Sugar phosphate isomerase/epimerase [Chitinophaga niabensis]
MISLKKGLLAMGLMAAMYAMPATAQKKEAKLGWKFGAQAYSFRLFTLAEALDKMDSCGLQYVECYPGQKIGGGIEGNMDYKMDAAKRAQVLDLLKSKKKTLVAFGVVNGNNETEWRQIFEFAKAMGIKSITSEPARKDLDIVSSLCDEYKIKLAIHDHPKPSHYWHPDSVLAAINGRSKYMGACADIGHWVRSGLDPVECIQKLNGKVYSLHFKDLNEKSPKAHDVIWTTGVSNMEGVLKELKKQKFQGLFSAEYEHNWQNSVPDITQSVKNIRAVVEKL